MQYNVTTLLKEPIGSTRELKVDSAIEDEGQQERVVGSASLLRTKAGVLVRAHLRALAPQRCSRCLRDLDYPFSLNIEEEFLQSVDLATGAPLSPPDDPDAFQIDAEQQLDLAEAVRQYSVTLLPMQPLCRPDCLGLCPRCGHDLNQGPCGCPATPPNEQWEALFELKNQ